MFQLKMQEFISPWVRRGDGVIEVTIRSYTHAPEWIFMEGAFHQKGSNDNFRENRVVEYRQVNVEFNDEDVEVRI